MIGPRTTNLPQDPSGGAPTATRCCWAAILGARGWELQVEQFPRSDPNQSQKERFSRVTMLLEYGSSSRESFRDQPTRQDHLL